MKPLAANVLMVPASAGEDQDATVKFAGADIALSSGRKSAGGVDLPSANQQVQSKPSEGVVRAIGDDVTLKIKEGDRCLYRSWTGIEVRINGIDHQLTPQRDVLAIIEEGEQVEVISRPMPAPQQKRPFG